ncbi:ATP-binding cassette domain-containing protein [Gordonia hankookensis]|uniref:ATP-binding cassette domain-containing protein n=1 Tax=Gordonia hankookensis TaxID=589403 RepID=A0ABR7WA84_9ACTN|nr:ATP-binding cassette domain-containing protein [Gordonia hankookensis]MBD1319721.1 ATP-binding cassette domain-containing protein [Gordonia hankookensis]
MNPRSVHDLAIEARGLVKRYDDKLVLDGLDLTIPRGEVFALLGPNGSGKTTTVNILSTLIDADAGRVVVGGHDLADNPNGIRSIIGVTGQFAALDDLLTGRENLQLMADLNHLGRGPGRARVDALLVDFDLVDAADRAVSTYSGGMRRRLDLAMTLVSTPEVIFLDEPTTGLDPRSRRTLWDTISGLARDGVTVFLTTQYLEEADRLADRVAVLDQGSIVAQGTPSELKSLVPGSSIHLVFADDDTFDRARSVFADATAVPGSRRLDLSTDDTVRSLREALGRIESEQLDLTDVSVHTASLDDVFFALTGRAEPQADDQTIPHEGAA